jgi:hypothetical protein
LLLELEELLELELLELELLELLLEVAWLTAWTPCLATPARAARVTGGCSGDVA